MNLGPKGPGDYPDPDAGIDRDDDDYGPAGTEAALARGAALLEAAQSAAEAIPGDVRFRWTLSLPFTKLLEMAVAAAPSHANVVFRLDSQKEGEKLAGAWTLRMNTAGETVHQADGTMLTIESVRTDLEIAYQALRSLRADLALLTARNQELESLRFGETLQRAENAERARDHWKGLYAATAEGQSAL